MRWWDERSRKRGGTRPQNTTLGPHHTSGSLHRPKVKSLSTGPETHIKISGHILQQLASYKYAVRYCKAARRVWQERVITKQHPGKWPCVPITHSHCWQARPWFKQMTQTWINTERLCVISWFTDCCRVEGALTQPFFLPGFTAWRQPGGRRSQVLWRSEVTRSPARFHWSSRGSPGGGHARCGQSPGHGSPPWDGETPPPNGQSQWPSSRPPPAQPAASSCVDVSQKLKQHTCTFSKTTLCFFTLKWSYQNNFYD